MSGQETREQMDIRQIKRKMKQEMAAKDRQESNAVYGRYLQLLSQDEFRAGVESTSGGKRLMRARHLVQLLSWVALAVLLLGSIAFLVLALNYGASKLSGLWLLGGLALALNKLEVELNLRAVARGLHVIERQPRKALLPAAGSH